MSLRESVLTREIEDLKSKLAIKTSKLDEAIKTNSKVHVHEVHGFNYLS